MKVAGSIDGPQEGPSVLLRSVGGEAVVVNDAALLFSADFTRDGPDLLLENPGAPTIRIIDYFAHAAPADLSTPDGATLRGPVVERLAGPEAPGQYAQVGSSPRGDPIGQVETLEGIARAQRADGTLVDLQIGTKVYQNDVLITENGGKVSITFVDGTIFTLASGSRMVLDELVYAADSEDNSAAFSLVEGSFVFIAGQVAKSGDMEVTTPSATMGIRGTTVLVDIQTVQGVTTVAVSLNTDPDGGLGEIVITDLDGNEITTITTTDTKWVVPVGDEAYEVERTADDLAEDSIILADAATAYATALARLEAGQSLVELDSSSNRSGSGDNDSETGAEADLGDDGDESGGGGDDSGGQDPEGATPSPDIGPDPTKLDGNDAPVPEDAGFEVPEDTRLDRTLAATDPDGDPITFSLQTGTENGLVVLLETGEFTYTPNENFNGTDSFTYSVSDGQGGSTSATATIDVTPVDDAPVAPDSTNAGAEGTTISGVLAATDIDSPDDDITYAPADAASPLPDGLTLASAGGYSLDAADQAYEDIASGEQRVVTFDYVATSGELSDTGTLSITVTGENDAPVLAGAGAVAVEDGPVVTLDLAALGTDVDSDDDGTTLSYSVTGAPAEGSASITGSTLSFDPGAGFQDLAAGATRDVTIRVTATDAHGATAENDVTVTVTGENDAPVILLSDFAPVPEGDAGVLSNVVFDPATVLTASDVDTAETPQIVAGSLSIAAAGDSDTGTVAPFSIGATTATVDTASYDFLGAGESGRFILSFDVISGTQVSTQGAVIEITGENDAPVASDVAVNADEDGPAITINATVSDPDAGDTRSFTLGTLGTSGTVTNLGNGQFSYDPDGQFESLAAGVTTTDSFTYTVEDAAGETSTATVTVTVTGENDAPVAEDLLVSGDNDGPITGTVLGFDPDAGESPQFSLGGLGPDGGEVTVNSDGSFSYTPDEGFTGFDSFEVTASDGSLSDSATVTVAVNDPGPQEAQDRGLGISIDIESVEGRPAGSVNVTRSTVEATPINLVFAMDGSGSFADEFADQITAVKDALAALAVDFDNPNAPQVDVQIIVFASGATSYGKNGADDPANGFTPFDLVQDAAAIQTALDGISHPGGGTDWHEAINDAKEFFDQENTVGNDEVDILYFITDGQPSGSDSLWQNAIKSIRDAHDPEIFTFGIGGGFDPTKLEQTFTIGGTDYRFDSDGDAKTITAASDLTAEIQETGLFAAELVSFSLELESDGTDHGVIATAIDADGTGFTLPLASVAGIENMLGEVNDLVATAVFDLDGDVGTTGDQITIVEAGRLSTPDGAVSPTSSDGADLLLGGAAADTLDGGLGDDLLIGGGGNDSLLGGGGNDRIFGGANDDLIALGAPAGTVLADGGTGRDTLRFDMAGDLTSDVLPTLTITDIEALDMENGQVNSLSLTLADIEGLSSERDTDLEALLGGALGDPDSATVYGDVGDSLELTNPAGSIQKNPGTTGPVTDNGATFDIYQFFDGSNTLLATLAVDDDVNVSMVVA